MADLNSTPATAATTDLLDARDALDDLGEKIEVLRLALQGMRSSGDMLTPRMIDPLLAHASEMRDLRSNIAECLR
jgi:hypothetical protein